MKEKIREIILEVAEKYGIRVDRIILFGSRARGDYRNDSDWDILIVSKSEVDRSTERKFLYECVLKLLSLNIDAEPVLVSKNYYIKHKDIFGDICGIATLGGVII